MVLRARVHAGSGMAVVHWSEDGRQRRRDGSLLLAGRQNHVIQWGKRVGASGVCIVVVQEAMP